jgi:hypothetical protein
MPVPSSWNPKLAFVFILVNSPPEPDHTLDISSGNVAPQRINRDGCEISAVGIEPRLPPAAHPNAQVLASDHGDDVIDGVKPFDGVDGHGQLSSALY